jgi:uncharacterized protein
MNKYGVRVTQGPSVIKDVDGKKGIVISYPSTFDVVDGGRERVKRGAFNRTINAWGPEGKKRTKVLFNHEPWSIIGRPLVLREDDIGLYAESHIAPTRLGKDVLTLIENEVITEQSIGYNLVRSEKSEDDNVLDILEVKLFEYSFLAWGMNSETPIVGLKGPSRDTVKDDMRRVEKVLSSGEFETEEVPELLTRCLKQWQEDLDQEEPVTIRRAIKTLESLLPQDSPSGTPVVEDSAKSGTDSVVDHSEALTKLLAKVTENQERDRAAHMLLDFQKRLGL